MSTHDLDPDVLKEWITRGRDREYLVVDIRKPESYEREHLPGAVHIPVMEVESHALIRNAGERDIVFYCRNGKRSKAAVLFAADAGVPMAQLFHLRGGLVEYEGEILTDLPRLDLFPRDASLEEQMITALNLEKAAFDFYGRILPDYKGTPAEKWIQTLAGAERTHGRAIFRQLDALHPQATDFDSFFQSLSGAILEGGKSWKEVDDFLKPENSNKYLNVLDFALEMEVAAYDLYRNLAEKVVEPLLKEMFFMLAQSEKDHIEMVVKTLELDI